MSHRRLISEVGFLFLLIFYYRYLLYFFVNEATSVPYNAFFKASSFLAVSMVVCLFAVNTHLSWRIRKADMQVLAFGIMLQAVAVLQRSAEGFFTAFQIFTLPLLLRWVCLVRRSMVKAALFLMAVGSSLFFTGEFLAVNNEWLGLFAPNSVVLEAYKKWNLSVISSAELPKIWFPVAGEDPHLTRPFGVLAYILNSGAALAMLCAFFTTEFFAFRRLLDLFATIVSLFGLALSTSTTSIVAFFSSVVMINLLVKPRWSLVVGHGRSVSLLGMGAVGLVIIFVWPVIDALYHRLLWALQYGESGPNMPYIQSFVPSFAEYSDILRFLVGGNFGDLHARHQLTGPWEYQGQTVLHREASLFNFIALFGVVPMFFVYRMWLKPFARLRGAQYVSVRDSVPFLTAFLAGIFTLLHDQGILNWGNIFFFYVYYEWGSRFMARADRASKVFR